MALQSSNYGEGKRWKAQNDDLPEGKHQGVLFEFRCWEGKPAEEEDGAAPPDWVSFGFQVGELRVQRFYSLTTKNGKSRGWILERDMRALLGSAPPVDEVQVDGRTGPIRHKLVGLVVNLFHGERDGYTDVYIDGVETSEAGGGW